MPTIELNFPAYTAMPRILCSEVLKKKFIVLNMRRQNFDDGPHLPRHFRSSFTRVTHDILCLIIPLGDYPEGADTQAAATGSNI